MDWRISEHFCIRFMFGLWLPFIVWRRQLKYFGFAMPGIAIAFDYE